MIQLPAVIVENGKIIRTVDRAEVFTDTKKNRHSAIIWELWSHQDFAEACAPWRVYSIFDKGPDLEEGQVATRNPMSQWTFGETTLNVTYTITDAA